MKSLILVKDAVHLLTNLSMHTSLMMKQVIAYIRDILQ